MKNKFKRRSPNIGLKVICETVKKASKIKKALKGRNKQQQILLSKGKEQKKQETETQKSMMNTPMILLPEMECLAFDFEEKNHCQKTVDSILSQNTDSVSTCNALSQNFEEYVDIWSKKDDSKNESIFQAYLHQVNSVSHSSISFGLISSVELPELQEIELFLRDDLDDVKSEVNSQFYSLSFLSPIQLNYSQLLSIYNFNVGFYKDFLQEGNQISAYIFEHFLQSKVSIKFLQVLLSDKYSSLNAKKEYPSDFLKFQNLAQSTYSMQPELEQQTANDLINFKLIEQFTCQKRKEFTSQDIYLADLFNRYSDSEDGMIEEIPQGVINNQQSNLIDLKQDQKEQFNIDQILKNDKENEVEIEINLSLTSSESNSYELINSKDSENTTTIEDQQVIVNEKLSSLDIKTPIHQPTNDMVDEALSSLTIIDSDKKVLSFEMNNQVQDEQINQKDDSIKQIEDDSLQKTEDVLPKEKEIGNPESQQPKPRIRLDGSIFQETKLLKNIPSVLRNEEFQETYKQNLFRHVFLSQDIHQIIQIFDPSTTTVDEFIKSISFHTGMTYDVLKQKLTLKNDVSQKDLESDSLFDCIYRQPEKYLKDHAQIFFTIRKHFLSSQDKSLQNQLTEQLQQMTNTTNTPNDLNPQNNNNNKNKWHNNNSSVSEYHQFNRRNPLVLCKKVNHLRMYDYINETHIKGNKGVMQSCVCREFTDNKINIQLLPLEHFYLHCLSKNVINSLLQSTSIFSQIKDIMIVRDFACNRSLEKLVNPELLIESFSMTSYNKTKNLELLEVIGDVVIKYISSLFLYLHLPNQSENTLTQIRAIFINNKYLGIAAFRNCLQFYVQTKKPNSYDWRFNFFNLTSFTDIMVETKNTNPLTHSNLSDVLESVVGAFFVSNNFSLGVCIELIKQLGLNIDKHLTTRCSEQVKGSFVLDDMILDQMRVEEDMTYYELYLLTQKEYQRKNETVNPFCEEDPIKKDGLQNLITTNTEMENDKNDVFIWNLLNCYINKELQYKKKYEVEYENNIDPNQRRKDRAEYRRFKELHQQTLDMIIISFEKILNYRFKDRSLLVKALNCHSSSSFQQYSQDYQILEFLGDAIIEILVVSNGYHISRNKQNKINTPYFFCEMKSLLLSNDFLSRMVVLNNFHYYALNISRYQQDEILQFIEDCNLNSKFKEPVVHQANSPKILGDLWESVAGAIIMDSDISTFVSIYGKLYAPYIIHFVTYYNKIIFNVKEKVQLVAQQTYEQLGKLTEVVQDTDGQYKVKVTILIKKIKVGYGIDFQETLAEKKAFQDAYNNIFIKQTSNLGLVFQGKDV